MSPALTWEARDPQTLAYYRVLILDMHGGKVLCQFSDNWKTCWVHSANVRPSPQSKSSDLDIYSPGQTIEVHVRREEDQPLGWWQATLKSIKQNVACVQFLDTGECILVDLQEMRPLNRELSIDLSRYKKMEMTLPENLSFDVAWSRSEGKDIQFFAVLSSVRQRCSLVAISYRPANHQIVVIGEDNALELSRPVIDMAVAQRGQLQQMRRTTDDLKQELSRITSPKDQHRAKGPDSRQDGRQPDVIEEFKLDPGLIGAVIGRGGKRINKVQALPGILKINIDAESATVTIVGDSKTSVRRAREALELLELRISIPSGSLDIANEIVKEVESRSNLQRIQVDRTGEGKDSSLYIVITGKKATVNWAVNHIRRQIGI